MTSIDPAQLPEQRPIPPQLLFNPEEAGEVLGVSRSRVYELMGSGELRSVHLGRLRRIRAQDLERFVEDLD